MKSFHEWRAEHLFEDVDATEDRGAGINMRKLIGPSSALGSGSEHVDRRVLNKMKTTLLPLVMAEYPDPQEALHQIISAAMSMLERLGTSYNPTRARKAFDRKPPIEPPDITDQDSL